MDFLDLTIYKSQFFPFTNVLDTKTYQKPHNLHQYLHYSSNHDKAIFKAIISGELIRYVRTNTLKENYIAMAKLLKTRLTSRGYPIKLIDKITATVHYETRDQLLNACKSPEPKFHPPIYKCLLQPQFTVLKHVILRNYSWMQSMVPAPRFIPLKHPTLRNELIRARLSPTDSQLVDILMSLQHQDTSDHTIAGHLPDLRPTVRTQKCNHPRCATCKHLNCSKTIKCTRTGVSYPIRQSFSCTSTNLVYVITCTKCTKQYVGLTTKKLSTRINHHRTNIFSNKAIYVSKHFNLPDHSVDNLSVQAIDCVQTNDPNPMSNLKKLESYWIRTLQTVQPSGLNVNT